MEWFTRIISYLRWFLGKSNERYEDLPEAKLKIEQLTKESLKKVKDGDSGVAEEIEELNDKIADIKDVIHYTEYVSPNLLNPNDIVMIENCGLDTSTNKITEKSGYNLYCVPYTNPVGGPYESIYAHLFVSGPMPSKCGKIAKDTSPVIGDSVSIISVTSAGNGHVYAVHFFTGHYKEWWCFEITRSFTPNLLISKSNSTKQYYEYGAKYQEFVLRKENIDFWNGEVGQTIKVRYDGKFQFTDMPIGLPVVTSADNGKIVKVVNGSWNKSDIPTELPAVTASDNGNFMQVVNGTWRMVPKSYAAERGYIELLFDDTDYFDTYSSREWATARDIVIAITHQYIFRPIVDIFVYPANATDPVRFVTITGEPIITYIGEWDDPDGVVLTYYVPSGSSGSNVIPDPITVHIKATYADNEIYCELHR